MLFEMKNRKEAREFYSAKHHFVTFIPQCLLGQVCLGVRTWQMHRCENDSWRMKKNAAK